jgi:hypothetical protein
VNNQEGMNWVKSSIPGRFSRRRRKSPNMNRAVISQEDEFDKADKAIIHKAKMKLS